MTQSSLCSVPSASLSKDFLEREEGNRGRGAEMETARRGQAAWPELKVPSNSR